MLRADLVFSLSWDFISLFLLFSYLFIFFWGNFPKDIPSISDFGNKILCQIKLDTRILYLFKLKSSPKMPISVKSFTWTLGWNFWFCWFGGNEICRNDIQMLLQHFFQELQTLAVFLKNCKLEDHWFCSTFLKHILLAEGIDFTTVKK